MTAPLLDIDTIAVAYGPITALRGVSLHVDRGEMVALLGANGAGKSTLLRTIVGFLAPSTGTITFAGVSLPGLRPQRRARLGLAYSPEGRRVFPGMTVRENLEVAAAAGRHERNRRMDGVYEIFPQLAEKEAALGWKLSGGQQQMLAIGRALMGAPRLLLLDEPSLGLSPLLTQEVLNGLRDIVATGTTVLLAEQNVAMALDICDRAYVLQTGVVVRAGSEAELRDDDAVKRAFLGG